MAQIPFIQPEDVEDSLTWKGVSDAIHAGHQRGKADIDDIIFGKGKNTLLNRAAWVGELGIAVKTATIFPENTVAEPPLPSVHSVVSLFEDQQGKPIALVDGALVTKWKTAGDSVLGGRLLVRPDSKTLAICGAGIVAASLIDAWTELFPGIERVLLWNRTKDKAEALAVEKARPGLDIQVVDHAEDAASQADILSSATMSYEPLIKGAWIKPGTHVDLIGAFRPDMREGDDELLRKSRIFVDSRATTMHDIGEIRIPLEAGTITADDIQGDYYDLCNGASGRQSDDEITLFKNGGGAHLDLMTAMYIRDVYLQKG